MMLERSIRSDILEPLLLVAVAVTFREVMVRTLNKKNNIIWKNRSGPIRSDPIRSDSYPLLLYTRAVALLVAVAVAVTFREVKVALQKKQKMLMTLVVADHTKQNGGIYIFFNQQGFIDFDSCHVGGGGVTIV
jgi:hypothetical protein